MYDEININVKIFYYIIKKIKPHTLARMGFFCNYTPPEQIDGEGGF